MKDKDKLYEELDEHAPSLKSLHQSDDGLRMPPGYLEELETDVFRQLDAIGATRKPIVSEAKPSLWQWLQSLWQPRLALAFAGMLAIALVAWWYFIPKEQNMYPGVAAVPISAEDAEAYLLDNLMELEPQQIALVLPNDGLSTISIDPILENDPGAQATTTMPIEVTPDDIEDLLLDMTDEELESLLL